MRHRLKPEHRDFWARLREAGMVMIVVMGLALIGLALGLAFGMRLIG